jgi:hypothetical protein
MEGQYSGPRSSSNVDIVEKSCRSLTSQGMYWKEMTGTERRKIRGERGLESWSEVWS